MCKGILNDIRECWKSRDWHFIGILGLILYLLLLGMCVWQMHQLGDINKRKIRSKHFSQNINFTIQTTDSIADAEVIAKLDSIVEELRRWDNLRGESLQNGLNDLRQETNNVIEKQNGWFAFWLGILALVGALLPFVVQLKVQHDQKQRVDAELDKIITLRMEQEKSNLCDEITKLSYTLIACKENRWGKEDYDRNQFWTEMFDSLCRNVGSLFTKIDMLKSEDISRLKMILLQLHAVLCVYIPTSTKSYKSRKLLALTHEIGDVVEKISSNSYATVQEFRNALDRILVLMGSIQL